MKRKILNGIYKEAPLEKRNIYDNYNFYGSKLGMFGWFSLIIYIVIFPTKVDPEMYLIEAIFMTMIFVSYYVYLLTKKKREINKLNHLNDFLYQQLYENFYFYTEDHGPYYRMRHNQDYFINHELKPRASVQLFSDVYKTFYENKVPISHESRISFFSSKLEEENKNWELLESHSCEINQNIGYEIIGELIFYKSVSYDLIAGNLRYNFGTPWYRKLFTRKADDNVIYALKERYNKEQKNKIILISKNELCLFNIIYTSQK